MTMTTPHEKGPNLRVDDPRIELVETYAIRIRTVTQVMESVLSDLLAHLGPLSVQLDTEPELGGQELADTYADLTLRGRRSTIATVLNKYEVTVLSRPKPADVRQVA